MISDTDFQEKSKSQKSNKITIRKCVQERKIDPNPTYCGNFDEHKVKPKNPNWSGIGISRTCFCIFCMEFIHIYISKHLKTPCGGKGSPAGGFADLPDFSVLLYDMKCQNKTKNTRRQDLGPISCFVCF